MATKEYKLDIFKCIAQINKKDIHFYEQLSVEEKKGFAAVIITRWLYGTPHDLQVVLLNETVNPYIFSLGKHPELIYKLMTTTAVSPATRHKWIPKHQDATLPTSLKIIAQYYGISKREAKLHLPEFTVDDIICMGEEIGMQLDELKKLKLELKKL